MLAYSSIAHTGYILVGLAAFGAAGAAAEAAGLQAVLFYSVAYAVHEPGRVRRASPRSSARRA